MNIKSRGANGNPLNRFERFHVEVDPDAWVDDDSLPLKTQFIEDDSQSALTAIDAQDLSFNYGLNPYRGCEHGCAYCYARTYHEYLGYSAGLDFESKIVVKSKAPQLLEAELAKSSYRPGVVSMSGVTDCYQPIERKLEITRRCLEVLANFRNPVAIITKNALVTRDLDFLAELAKFQAVAVYLSITTLDRDLGHKLEPRASSPRARLEAIRCLSEAGVQVGVSVAPMIPGLNDSELPAILRAVADHGGKFAAFSVVRLPGAVEQVFSNWLEQHRPMAQEKILGRIRSCHRGKLNTYEPGKRHRGTGEAARQLHALYHAVCRKNKISPGRPELNVSAFRRLSRGQGELF